MVIPAATAAKVDVDRGPSSVVTEGEWTTYSSSYSNGGSGPTWMIQVVMGVGTLTLVSR